LFDQVPGNSKYFAETKNAGFELVKMVLDRLEKIAKS